MKTFLLFLFPLLLSASQILSYNIYERSDRADVMITFDTPFTGVIKQGNSTNKIIIKLEGATIESSKVKRVNSQFLHSLTITPLQNQTQIVATVSANTRLIASKTADSYGLRLRFTKKTATRSGVMAVTKEPNLSALPTKKSEEFSRSYYIVVAILIIGIIILLYLKKRIAPKQASQTKAKNSWLFTQNTNSSKEEKPTQNSSTPKTKSEVSIRFQKSIDDKSNVVMFDFGAESYLVLMGNSSNILLNIFRDDKPTTQEEFETLVQNNKNKEFETILQDRNKELEDFLGTSTTSSHTTKKESLHAYTEAASLMYDEES
jgi:hypothetical protein